MYFRRCHDQCLKIKSWFVSKLVEGEALPKLQRVLGCSTDEVNFNSGHFILYDMLSQLFVMSSTESVYRIFNVHAYLMLGVILLPNDVHWSPIGIVAVITRVTQMLTLSNSTVNHLKTSDNNPHLSCNMIHLLISFQLIIIINQNIENIKGPGSGFEPRWLQSVFQPNLFQRRSHPGLAC